jgi:hypothetical protein
MMEAPTQEPMLPKAFADVDPNPEPPPKALPDPEAPKARADVAIPPSKALADVEPPPKILPDPEAPKEGADAPAPPPNALADVDPNPEPPPKTLPDPEAAGPPAEADADVPPPKAFAFPKDGVAALVPNAKARHTHPRTITDVRKTIIRERKTQMREPLFYSIAVLGINGWGGVHQQWNPNHVQKPLW